MSCQCRNLNGGGTALHAVLGDFGCSQAGRTLVASCHEWKRGG